MIKTQYWNGAVVPFIGIFQQEKLIEVDELKASAMIDESASRSLFCCEAVQRMQLTSFSEVRQQQIKDSYEKTAKKVQQTLI